MEDVPPMQITITSRNMDLQDDLRLYATQRIQTLKKYSANIIKARAVLGHNRGAYHTELILRADHHRFFGEVKLPDARASVDSAVEKVERQLQRFKDKVQRKHKHELEPGRPPIEPVIDDEGEFEYEGELQYEEHEAEGERLTE
jgi:putative sigma-54 modulation protein